MSFRCLLGLLMDIEHAKEDLIFMLVEIVIISMLKLEDPIGN